MTDFDLKGGQAVVVIGGGGHARSVIAAARAVGLSLAGFTDINPNAPKEILGVKHLGSDRVLTAYDPKATFLLNGLGSVGDTQTRQEVFNRLRGHGFRFAAVIHPAAFVAEGVVLGEGVQVMAGAVLQIGVRLGDNCLINTGAVVDHDCVIGDHVHVAPGATLSGEVKVGAGAHLGTGATVIQGVSIGPRALVAAGSTVVRDVKEATAVAGVPAKAFQRRGQT